MQHVMEHGRFSAVDSFVQLVPALWGELLFKSKCHSCPLVNNNRTVAWNTCSQF